MVGGIDPCILVSYLCNVAWELELAALILSSVVSFWENKSFFFLIFLISLRSLLPERVLYKCASLRSQLIVLRCFGFDVM